MTAESVYGIARYDVHTENEVLIERAQLFRENGALRRRVDDGPEASCPDNDVAAVIGADPALHEVRANQVTRITGEPAVLEELPFVLRPAGDWGDFDEELWSWHLAPDNPNVYVFWDGGRWRGGFYPDPHNAKAWLCWWNDDKQPRGGFYPDIKCQIDHHGQACTCLRYYDRDAKEWTNKVWRTFAGDPKRRCFWEGEKWTIHQSVTDPPYIPEGPPPTAAERKAERKSKEDGDELLRLAKWGIVGALAGHALSNAVTPRAPSGLASGGWGDLIGKK